MKQLIYILIGLGLTMAVFSCKDNEPDPCSGLKPTSADFVILDAYLDETEPGSSDLVTDTICNSYATFSFTGVGDSLVWKIGLGTYNKKVVYIDFSDKPVYLKSLPISLTVFNKKPNTSCFPTDNGKASKTRTLVFKDWHSSKIFGTWEGYNTDKPDSVFKITIKDTLNYTVRHNEKAYYISNLFHQNKMWVVNNETTLNFASFNACIYNQDYTDTNIRSIDLNCIISNYGTIKSNNNSLMLTYNYFNTYKSKIVEIKKTFIGIKSK